jgi:hypothetical protein
MRCPDWAVGQLRFQAETRLGGLDGSYAILPGSSRKCDGWLLSRLSERRLPSHLHH